MNKKIIVLIELVTVLIVIIAGIYYYQSISSKQPQTRACTQEAKLCPDGSAVGRIGPNCEFSPCPAAPTQETACLSSGGQATSSLCCKSADDFPNTCLVGACGCSPDNSKSIKTCDCGEGKCFDGATCTDQRLNITIYCTNKNCMPEQIFAGAGVLFQGCFRDINECAADAGWKKYENNKFGFELKFPKSWDGYIANEGDYPNYSYVGFSFKGGHQPFTIFQILSYSKEQRDKAEKNISQKILIQNASTTIACDGCCDSNSDTTGGGQFDEFQKARCQEAEQIISTFNLKQAQASLPVGYTLDHYKVERILPNICKFNSDCETPMEYLLQSRCPFTSLCLNNKCAVVCPDFMAE
jgi:hypothetical protein